MLQITSTLKHSRKKQHIGRRAIVAAMFLPLCALINKTSFAQAGYLDPTFNTTGYNVTTHPTYPMIVPNDIVIQNDGKAVVVSEGWMIDNNDMLITRYNTDGTIDTDFGTDGFVVFDHEISYEVPTSVLLQDDGKIVVSGHMFYFPGETNPFVWFVARFNTDGSIDSSFGDSGYTLLGSNDFNPKPAYDAAIQNDGKILVVGETQTSGFTRGTVVRFNEDGTIDDTFGNAGVFYPYPDAIYNGLKGIMIQPDGMIVVCGDVIVMPNMLENDYIVMRFDQDAVLDGNFGNGGIVAMDSGNMYGKLQYHALQDDGKMLFSGTYRLPNNNSGYFTSLLRLNEDGSLDNTFGESGSVYIEYNPTFEDLPRGLLLKADGSIVVSFATPQYLQITGNLMMLKQFTTDGDPDTAFGTDGLVQLDLTGNDASQAIALQSDGKVMMIGTSLDANDNMQKQVVARVLPEENIIGVEENTLSISTNVYPNPAQDMLQVSFELTQAEHITMELYQADGKLVKSVLVNQSLPQGLNQIALDLTELSGQSVYFIEILNSAGQMSTVSFIKE